MRIAVFIAATLEIVAWLFRLPALFSDLSGPYTPAYVATLATELLVFPALAITAFVLAYRNRNLRIAAILAAIEPALFFAGILLLSFGIARFGF